MAKKVDNRTTKPLITAIGKPTSIDYYGFGVELTSDELGLVITAPSGKVFDLANPRFQVSPDGKRLEVRVK